MTVNRKYIKTICITTDVQIKSGLHVKKSHILNCKHICKTPLNRLVVWQKLQPVSTICAKLPALISQRDNESAYLRGYLASNFLPASRVPAKNTEGAIPTWYSQILASIIDEDSKHRLIREK